MKYCPRCGVLFSDAANECRRCKIPLEMVPDGVVMKEGDITPEELKEKKKKDWIAICIGVPVLFGIIFGIYFLMKILQG
ncbi:MAG: hypothetical protein IJP37_01450 [Clostridia bacterium]|nr:hypothetical protein [Clostridia bacterium]MBR0025803.1 hypothetical protein [Clostridia bacterium]